MRDFTRQKYAELLRTLQEAGYRFMTLEEYAEACGLKESDKPTRQPEGKVVVMRHDVDKHPWNSLLMAQLEAQMGVRATYYFRIVPDSNREDVIRSVKHLGHEVGYHYEDMSLRSGQVEDAYRSFKENLRYFRMYYPVRTICMHGAPTSRYDGRDLWKTHDYRHMGLICEPYLDLDYSQLFYLTDTGRRWDGYRVSLRDKIPVYQDAWSRRGLTFHRTDQILEAIREGRFPERVLITTHPQRWNENMRWWWRELLEQRAKNLVKFLLVLFRKS